MKWLCIFTVALVLLAYFTAKADVPVFGNNPLGPPAPGDSGLNVGYFNYDVLQQIAVFFTPTENLQVGSVTLWVTGYSGSVAQNLNLNVGICNTEVLGDTLTNVGTSIAQLTTPAPNDGSSASFTFADSAGSVTLQENEEYCFLVAGDPVVPHGVSSAMVTLEEGDTPTGDAVYDGAVYIQSQSSFPDGDTPAFTINTVPEPSEYVLIGLGAIVFGFCYRHRQLRNYLKSSRPAGIGER